MAPAAVSTSDGNDAGDDAGPLGPSLQQNPDAGAGQHRQQDQQSAQAQRKSGAKPKGFAMAKRLPKAMITRALNRKGMRRARANPSKMSPVATARMTAPSSREPATSMAVPRPVPRHSPP